MDVFVEISDQEQRHRRNLTDALAYAVEGRLLFEIKGKMSLTEAMLDKSERRRM